MDEKQGMRKRVLTLAIPSIIESFFVAFAGLVDSLMVSSISSFAVAAVGITTQPKFIALAIFIALSVATSAVVARRFGEGRRDEANRTLLTSLIFALVACVCVSLLFVAFADEIIRFCGSTENTHDDAVTYLKIIVGGMIFNCIQIVINAAQRGSGNTKITMLTNVTSNTVNVIFNYLLIGGHFGFPALGIRGAAIATVLGTVVSSVMSVISLIPKNRFLNISYIIKERILPKLSTFAVLCKFGYSVFIEQILLRIGFAATALMAADMGDTCHVHRDLGGQERMAVVTPPHTL
jgi:putative MATE family efflux protein